MHTWQRESNPLLKPQSTGAWVRHGDQIGFAKGSRMGQEWLAAKLGELVKAQVPKVEFGIVAGERFTVSHVLSPTGAPLSCRSRNYPEMVLRPALRRASGLIGFLAWIGAEDHSKQENYVATSFDVSGLYIEAIDFELSFGEFLNAPFSREVQLTELINNADPHQVEESLNAILSLPEDCVRACCERSGMGGWDTLADQLLSRRQHLQTWLKKEGLT